MYNIANYSASLVTQTVKHLPAMRETRVQSLGQEDPLEKEMAIIREMQIKTTMRCHLTLVRMAILKKSIQITNAGKGVEKTEPSYTVGGNVNWYSCYRKQHSFLKKLRIELPYDPAIPLLYIYPEKMKTLI